MEPAIDIAIGLVLTLSIMIFVHELGHFLAARRLGVRVERFSIGFGPRIVGFKRGETDYVISAVPFGGFVRMSGEDPDKELEGHDYEFMSKSKRSRALIVFAGPAMNFVLAVLIAVGIIAWGGIEVVPGTEIDRVVENSPAERAGLLPGDRVVAVESKHLKVWDDLVLALEKGLGRRLELQVERDQGCQTLTLDLRSVSDVGEVGILPFIAPVMGYVQRWGPAYEAGLRTGDRIVSLNGGLIRSWDDLRETILVSPGSTLSVVWERGGSTFSAALTPDDVKGSGRIQAYPETQKIPVTLAQAVRLGLQRMLELCTFIFRIPGLWLKGVLSPRDTVGGPVAIAVLAGESMRWGLGPFLSFLAAVSAQLCVVNLLPIPVLDGGHLLILAVEALKRKSITPKQRLLAHQIGFTILMLVVATVTILDVSRFMGR